MYLEWLAVSFLVISEVQSLNDGVVGGNSGFDMRIPLPDYIFEHCIAVQKIEEFGHAACNNRKAHHVVGITDSCIIFIAWLHEVAYQYIKSRPYLPGKGQEWTTPRGYAQPGPHCRGYQVFLMKSMNGREIFLIAAKIAGQRLIFSNVIGSFLAHRKNVTYMRFNPKKAELRHYTNSVPQEYDITDFVISNHQVYVLARSALHLKLFEFALLTTDDFHRGYIHGVLRDLSIPIDPLLIPPLEGMRLRVVSTADVSYPGSTQKRFANVTGMVFYNDKPGSKFRPILIPTISLLHNSTRGIRFYMRRTTVIWESPFEEFRVIRKFQCTDMTVNVQSFTVDRDTNWALVKATHPIHSKSFADMANTKARLNPPFVNFYRRKNVNIRKSYSEILPIFSGISIATLIVLLIVNQRYRNRVTRSDITSFATSD